MEKIKVNMSPNPLDVQTIHASQNDGEARQWEFELHNNGELIDTSDVKEQLVFKAYKGGTEQLLPENTSTPTTSPFKGDIRYPQGLLTDQEFTYRQSPTEEDGLAKITDIKGNTLVWNQLCNGIATLTTDGITTEYDSTTHKYKITNNSRTSNYATGSTRGTFADLQTTESGHKYLLLMTPQVTGVAFAEQIPSIPLMNCGNKTIWTSSGGALVLRVNNNYDFVTAHPVGSVTEFQALVIDLTRMFGAGKEPATVDEFTSLFPLSYYSYNQGFLLSFMGEQIKTTGKNLLPLPVAETKNGITLTHNNDGSITLKGTSTGNVYFDFFTNFDSSKYEGCLFTCRTSQTIVANVTYRISKNDRVGIQDFYTNVEGTVQNKGDGLYFAIRIAGNVQMPTDGYTLYPMLRMPNQDSTFEPYTSSILSLPISTYFPTGMKSAGNVYDELTESKAITRVGMVDLGSLTWTYMPNNYFRSSAVISDAKTPPNEDTVANILCSKLKANTANYVYANNEGIAIDGTGRIRIYYANMPTDATAFKTAMNGVMLYYELATPTETSFTTASLVTENTEIPLSNEDGALIGKCTEELSSQPGFIDAKIKLTDGDGTCYSNKLQLHVERKP